MKIYYLIILAVIAGALSSCGAPKPKDTMDEKISLDTHIDQLAQLAPLNPIGVNGYGITAGLWGTGSPECPSSLRPILEKYIRQQVPNSSQNTVREILESMDTAVVEIAGQIPPMAMVGDRFDLKVSPFAKTQTTSLESGQLYTADMMEISRLRAFDQYSKRIASASGQIYTEIDPATGKQQYYILGGGVCSVDTPITLLLNKSNYYAASAIRNRTNDRFGPETAKALSPKEVQIFIPARYRRERQRFLNMILSLYLSEDETLRAKRIDELCQQLEQLKDAEKAEIALEAIGRPAVPKLYTLIEDNKPEETRFRAARCLLNVGEPRAVQALSIITEATNSPFRIQAIQALASGKVKDVEPILIRLVDDPNFEVRMAAYERLVGHDSVVISRIPIGSDFFIDLVHSKGEKVIFAYRKDNAGIVLFGSPIEAAKDIFVDMKQIMINSRPEENHVMLSRRHPNKPKLVGPIRCSFRVEDIIRTLAQSPEVDKRKITWPGLGISYSEVLSVLDYMCKREIIPARFVLGPLTDAGAFLEKTEPKTDNIPAEEVKK